MMEEEQWITESPEREAADAFLDLMAGLSLEQISRALVLIAEGFERARADAAGIAEEARAIRKLLETEG